MTFAGTRGARQALKGGSIGWQPAAIDIAAQGPGSAARAPPARLPRRRPRARRPHVQQGVRRGCCSSCSLRRWAVPAPPAHVQLRHGARHARAVHEHSCVRPRSSVLATSEKIELDQFFTLAATAMWPTPLGSVSRQFAGRFNPQAPGIPPEGKIEVDQFFARGPREQEGAGTVALASGSAPQAFAGGSRAPPGALPGTDCSEIPENPWL